MKLKFRADLKDIVIFLIFCLVLLYLVAIAVINLNSVALDGTFRGLNPIPAFGSEFITATLLFYILSLVLTLNKKECDLQYFYEIIIS